jgi:hypothetical protein
MRKIGKMIVVSPQPRKGDTLEVLVKLTQEEAGVMTTGHPTKRCSESHDPTH